MSPAKKITSSKKKTKKIPVKNLASGKTAGKKTTKKVAKKEKLEDTKEMKNKKSKTYRNISLFFIVGALVMLSAIFYLTLSSLTITIIPAKERINSEVAFNVYDQNKNNQVSSSKESLKGIVEQVDISETKEYKSSGTEVIGEEVVGEVTIVNNYIKAQPLVATTRLLSPDNKLYRIKETISVPAGGSRVVEVYADEASPEMAIGPNKFTIPGLWSGLQDKIFAKSDAKFVYQQQVKKYVEQADIDKGFADIKKALAEKARKKLGDEYKGYNKVIYQVDENSISTEIDGKVGEERDSLTITMTTKVSVIAFSEDEVYNTAKSQLSVLIPDNKELVKFDKEDIVYNLVSSDIDQGRASIEVKFEGQMSLTEQADIVDPRKISGLTRQQLEDYLDNFPEISGYEVNFKPDFINKVPKLIDRINIEVK